MEYRDVVHVVSESSGGRAEDWHLFEAFVLEAEFDLNAAVNLATAWRATCGADGVNIRRKYVVGRFENRTLFAVITVPCYWLEGKLTESEEYFRRVNDPNDPAYHKMIVI